MTVNNEQLIKLKNRNGETLIRIGYLNEVPFIVLPVHIGLRACRPPMTFYNVVNKCTLHDITPPTSTTNV